MAKTVAQFLDDNICVIRKLASIGKIPVSVMNEYQIYKLYKSLNMPKKMDRYDFIADTFKTNSKTVRNAVKSMERIV